MSRFIGWYCICSVDVDFLGNVMCMVCGGWFVEKGMFVVCLLCILSGVRLWGVYWCVVLSVMCWFVFKVLSVWYFYLGMDDRKIMLY